MAHFRQRGSSASLCLLIDFHVGDLHQERHGGSTLRLVSCHRSRSMVSPMLFRRSLGYPSLLPTDSRRLEWQFSDPLSTHQNKVRHVTKGSQGMDLAWGTSPKFEGLSDWLLLAHLRPTP